MSQVFAALQSLTCRLPLLLSFWPDLSVTQKRKQDGIHQALTDHPSRIPFPLAYYRTGSDTPDSDYDHMFQTLEEEVAAFQATPSERPFWGLRVIWSTITTTKQTQPQTQPQAISRALIEDADSCIATKLMYPHLMAGYAPTTNRPLAGLLPELFWFRKQCAMEDVQVPFFLQAGGGADGEWGERENDLFDALLLGARRISHADTLHRHPRMVEAVRDKRILVETGLPTASGGDNTSLHNHPFPALLAQGVPCALTVDDGDSLEGIPENGSRITAVFWQALQAWDTLGLAGLGSLAENSVRWAAFEDQDADVWYVLPVCTTFFFLLVMVGWGEQHHGMRTCCFWHVFKPNQERRCWRRQL